MIVYLTMKPHHSYSRWDVKAVVTVLRRTAKLMMAEAVGWSRKDVKD